MDKELLALLRLGLGNSKPNEERLTDFSMMSAEQWARLGEIAQVQGVLGIALDGVCLDSTPYGPTKGLPKQLKLEWIGQVMRIEQGNHQQIKVMNQVADKMALEYIKMMVFKGQVNGLLYPNPLHRSPGDVDCYLFGKYSKGNDILRQQGAKVDEGWYKHSQISYNGELLENHLFFVHTREGKRSKLLQKELGRALQVKDWSTFPESKVLLPPTQWNAMFLTYHACAHFLSEGLRLKQILDWAMFIKKEQNNIDWIAFYDYCDKYHFRRFVDAMTAISVKYLGIIVENSEITTESPYIEKILNSTLYDEDYIYNAGESIWKSRWHVIRSLFKYRWRYEEVYQESVWKQLWWYATGYIFKTE